MKKWSIFNCLRLLRNVAPPRNSLPPQNTPCTYQYRRYRSDVARCCFVSPGKQSTSATLSVSRLYIQARQRASKESINLSREREKFYAASLRRFNCRFSRASFVCIAVTAVLAGVLPINFLLEVCAGRYSKFREIWDPSYYMQCFEFVEQIATCNTESRVYLGHLIVLGGIIGAELMDEWDAFYKYDVYERRNRISNRLWNLAVWLYFHFLDIFDNERNNKMRL